LSRPSSREAEFGDDSTHHQQVGLVLDPDDKDVLFQQVGVVDPDDKGVLFQ